MIMKEIERFVAKNSFYPMTEKYNYVIYISKVLSKNEMLRISINFDVTRKYHFLLPKQIESV